MLESRQMIEYVANSRPKLVDDSLQLLEPQEASHAPIRQIAFPLACGALEVSLLCNFILTELEIAVRR